MDAYSKTEIDAKLETSEQRIQNKLDRILMAIENIEVHWDKRLGQVESHWDKRFSLLEKDMGWMKLLLGVLIVPLMIAILGVMIAKP